MIAGTFTNSKNSHVSSSITQKNEFKVQSNAERSDSPSSLVQKGRQDSLADSKNSKIVAVDLETKNKTSNSLLESSAKGKGKKVNKTKSSEEGRNNIQSNEEMSSSLSAQIKVRDSDDEINGSSSKDVKPQSSFNKAVDVRSGKSDNTNAKGPGPHLPYKPEKWMLPQQAEDALTQLNLAVVRQ